MSGPGTLLPIGSGEMIPLNFSSANTMGMASSVDLMKSVLSKTPSTHTVIEIASGNAMVSHAPHPVPRPVGTSHAQSGAPEVGVAGKQVGGKNLEDGKMAVVGESNQRHVC